MAEPTAWVFELAKSIKSDGTYTNFGSPQLSFTKPHVPVGSIRNLRPLYAGEAVELVNPKSHASTSPGPINCNIRLRFQHGTYSRTCRRCTWGPCPFFNDDGTEKK